MKYAHVRASARPIVRLGRPPPQPHERETARPSARDRPRSRAESSRAIAGPVRTAQAAPALRSRGYRGSAALVRAEFVIGTSIASANVLEDDHRRIALPGLDLRQVALPRCRALRIWRRVMPRLAPRCRTSRPISPRTRPPPLPVARQCIFVAGFGLVRVSDHARPHMNYMQCNYRSYERGGQSGPPPLSPRHHAALLVNPGGLGSRRDYVEAPSSRPPVLGPRGQEPYESRRRRDVPRQRPHTSTPCSFMIAPDECQAVVEPSPCEQLPVAAPPWETRIFASSHRRCRASASSR